MSTEPPSDPRLRNWFRRPTDKVRATAKLWWRRHVVDDAPPYTDDDLERHRQRTDDWRDCWDVP